MNIPKPISTKTHGVLDYLTVGFALAFPRVLGCNRAFTNAVTTLALGKLAYTVLTRHELGLKKVIPMKTHLLLDSIGGATLAALPFITDEDDPAAVCCAVGMGVFDIAAAPLSETEMAADQPQMPLYDQQRQWIPRAPSMAAGVPEESSQQNETATAGGRFASSSGNSL